MFLRATPLVLRMWFCKSKLDEEKSKHAGLAEKNDFGPTFLHSLLSLMHSKAPPAKEECAPPSQEEECNKYDMTAAPCFWLANHDGLLLVVSPYICSPVLIL
jgi:hypothetical protein